MDTKGRKTQEFSPATRTLCRIFVALVENRKGSFKGKNWLAVLMNTL